MAWGMKNGQFSPKSLVQAACDGGFTWIALQVEGNDAYFDTVRNECTMNGLAFGLWEAEPSPNKRGEYPKTIVVFCDGCGLFTHLLMPTIENLEMEKR